MTNINFKFKGYLFQIFCIEDIIDMDIFVYLYQLII